MDDHCHSDASRPVPRSLPSLKALKSTTVLTAAVLLSLAVPAHAQFFWSSETAPASAERKKVRRTAQRAPKVAEAAKEQSKPVGPVIIAISIQKQQMKIYDANGVFAESPVSTGMAGHSTPMGVFSVIGKEIFHRSNIYSGAPMPHMQRITWSGVAMHAGVLPGYPASHGCIRLPPSFATRMYGWTSKGARVVITPGELTPEDFAHSNLITKKIALPDPNMPVTNLSSNDSAQPAPVKIAAAVISTTKTDKSAVTDSGSASDIKLTTTGSGDGAGTKNDNVRVADATNDMPAKTDAASDAKPDAINKDQARPNDEAKSADVKPAETKAADKPAPAIAETPSEPAMPGTAQFIGPTKPRSGQIAAFISRKEGKLFVRQNFEPLFDVQVTIAPGDKPLGTHVFTARADKDDADTLRWSVVSLPAPSRVAKRDDNPRRKKVAVSEPAPLPSPSTPGEALDRITISETAMKRIASAIGPGGSLVVSDYGLGDETGLGTEFIVTQR